MKSKLQLDETVAKQILVNLFVPSDDSITKRSLWTCLKKGKKIFLESFSMAINSTSSNLSEFCKGIRRKKKKINLQISKHLQICLKNPNHPEVNDTAIGKKGPHQSEKHSKTKEYAFFLNRSRSF